jgi:hypothetical protein
MDLVINAIGDYRVSRSRLPTRIPTSHRQDCCLSYWANYAGDIG